MLMLIDMHNLMHRAYWVHKNLSLEDKTPVGLLYGSINMLLTLMRKYAPTDLILCYDGGSRRRKAMYPAYKAQRKTMHNGFYQQFLILRTLMLDMGVKQCLVSGEEADDLIATLVAKIGGKEKVMIVSGDHDFLQLVDNNTFVLKDGRNEKFYTVDLVKEDYGVEPSKLVDMLAMVGDKSDNIAGLDGIGIKKASKLIQEYGSLGELIEKSKDGDDLGIIRDNVAVLSINKDLMIMERGLNFEIMRGQHNLNLVKALFKYYLKFNSFLSRWDEIERLASIGGGNLIEKALEVNGSGI